MSGIRILVAEDEDNLRGLIVKYFENEGLTVLEASNGEDIYPIDKRDNPTYNTKINTNFLSYMYSQSCIHNLTHL